MARFQGDNVFNSTTLEFRVDLCSNEKPRAAAAAYQLHWDAAPHLELFLFLALPPDGDVRDEANPKDFLETVHCGASGQSDGAPHTLRHSEACQYRLVTTLQSHRMKYRGKRSPAKGSRRWVSKIFSKSTLHCI